MCCYDRCVLLAKLLAFVLLHFVLKGQTYLLLQVSLHFLLLHSSPLWWKGHVFLVLVLGLVSLHRTIQLQLLQHYCLGHRLQLLWYWTVLWRPTILFRTNTQKRCPFHYRELECKSRKSRDTWNNRQIWPWSTKWSRAKANRVLPRECTGHSKHSLSTTREESTHEHHQVVNTKIRLIIFFEAKDREPLYSQQNKTRSWLWLRSWTP